MIFASVFLVIKNEQVILMSHHLVLIAVHNKLERYNNKNNKR